MKILVEIGGQTYIFMDQDNCPDLDKAFYTFNKLLSNIDYLNEEMANFDESEMDKEG